MERRGRLAQRIFLAGVLALVAGCGRGRESAPPSPTPSPLRPPLLLVTLDTTRADLVAPEADATATPALAALASRGLSFRQAYATAPTTLPSHASMLTGLYPGGHGLHENGRRLGDAVPIVSEELQRLGYATAAFVSGYPLERQFGLSRGFEVYDDAFAAGRSERSARETTDRALAWLAGSGSRPRFLWVHYYDPHEPYDPPEPFRSRFPKDPYRGEIAAMDHELGRLLEAFEAAPGGRGARIVVAADHGEGRGDHGEQLHGNLLYQGVMRVPLLVVGEGLGPGTRSDAVSLRQVRATLLALAGESAEGSLLAPVAGPVLGEAMQPYLNYRWQPQVMGVSGGKKLIRSGRLELYDVAADPEETRDLTGTVAPERPLARAVAEYPLPGAVGAPAASPASDEERRRLASLGYLVSGGAPGEVPEGAPRAADMTHLFGDLDAAALAFGRSDWARAASLFERILARDPGNVMAAVQLAACRSFQGKEAQALAAFELARQIDPRSLEVRHYLGLYYLRNGDAERAAPLLEEVLQAQPDRLAAIEALAEVRARQGRLPDAASLLERAAPLSRNTGARLAEAGLIRMRLGETEAAVADLERARALQGEAFRRDLELGVLYLAGRRLEDARAALDRVPPDDPEIAMALFKRAQVSVLLREPDANDRIRRAREKADATTRPLIASERLFARAAP